jgi:hypothetical protein
MGEDLLNLRIRNISISLETDFKSFSNAHLSEKINKLIYFLGLQIQK